MLFGLVSPSDKSVTWIQSPSAILERRCWIAVDEKCTSTKAEVFESYKAEVFESYSLPRAQSLFQAYLWCCNRLESSDSPPRMSLIKYVKCRRHGLLLHNLKLVSFHLVRSSTQAAQKVLALG
jgi:hypothetical protein